jgi:hypothetical protein
LIGSGGPDLPLLGAEEAAGATLASPNDVLHFRSRPDLRPPRLAVLRRGGSGRSLFLSPSSGPGQRGALILDKTGEVVWFRPTRPDTVMNFRTALYKGDPVLTWWQGRAERGLGVGVHVIVDSTYREVARLPAGAGRQSDLHEFMLTPRGTAIITSYEVRTMNLSGAGGPSSGKVIGGILQEIAIPSAGSVRVAQPRPRCGRRGVHDLQRPRLRLLPHQFRRPRCRRQPARLGEKHLGGLQAG